MSFNISRSAGLTCAAVACACFVVAAGAFGVATASSTEGVTVCAEKSGVLKLVPSETAECPKGTTGPLAWGATGPQGEPGPTGPPGPAGTAIYTTIAVSSGAQAVGPGASIAAIAACGTDKVLVGGGFTTADPSLSGKVLQSSPDMSAGANAWKVSAVNTTAASISLEVSAYAICASAS
jgi:hypothetical protein